MVQPGLILASASVRRLSLLAQIHVVPEKVVPADIDETPFKKEEPRVCALRLAREKALMVAREHPDKLVLGADTVVACGRRLLPKAQNRETARTCLALLSGRAHRVYTAVVLVGPGTVIRERVVMTSVRVKRLHPDNITRYLDSEEWHDKAGGYAIQGAFAAFVLSINGSYSGVVGLPLYDTAQLLSGAGHPITMGIHHA